MNTEAKNQENKKETLNLVETLKGNDKKQYIANLKENTNIIEKIKDEKTTEDNKKLFGKTISENKKENSEILAKNFNIDFLEFYNFQTLEIVFNGLQPTDENYMQVYEAYIAKQIKQTYIIENPKQVKKAKTKAKTASRKTKLILAILLAGDKGLSFGDLCMLNNQFEEPYSYSGFKMNFNTFELSNKGGFQPVIVDYNKKLKTTLPIKTKVVNHSVKKAIRVWESTPQTFETKEISKECILTTIAPEPILNIIINMFKEKLYVTDELIDETKETLKELF